MKRFLLGLCGVVLLLAGLLGAGGVGWLVSVFGTQGRYEVPVAQVDVPGAALYVNLFDVQRVSFLPEGLLDTYVSATNAEGTDLFMGVGEQEAVQDYLSGVPYEAASALVDGRFVTRPVPGDTVPAPDPSQANIWLDQSAGSAPRLLWTADAGAGVLVLMNADGSTGVAAALTASLESPRLVPIAGVITGLSVILTLGGLFMLARALRSDAGASHR